jgi:pyruvate,water dikinase
VADEAGGDRTTRGWRERLRAVFRRLRGREVRAADDAHTRTFSLMYDRFREILSLNNATLEMYADLEDRLAGRKPFALETVAQRARKAALDVFVMIKDLNQIAGGRHAALYDALHRLNQEIEEEFAAGPPEHEGPLAVALDELRASNAKAVGHKLANLGELRALGHRVPAGFAVTTRAFLLFMMENDLWRRAARLDSILEADGQRALPEACQEVRHAILGAPIPASVATAIALELERAFHGDVPELAVRSSAVGEDTAVASHAGLYHSRLNVKREELAEAYREVVASAFGPSAVSYRFDHGLTAFEAVMGVGCIAMVAPRAAGILFSRAPEEPRADRVVISVTPGVAAGVAAGVEDAELLTVTPPGTATSALLDAAEVVRLVEMGRAIERHFGMPQDIEWALDHDGQLVVLQARPMVAAVLETRGVSPAEGGRRPLLVGGLTACAGAAAGPVIRVRGEQDLEAFPEGGVLVARVSSPSFARVMRRCAAIVTDIGSPTGHMAILAREYRVPTIVSAERATAVLEAGEQVTVDATRRCVFAGALALEPGAEPGAPGAAVDPDLSSSPAVQSLRRVARLITPLTLTDPAHPDFRPERAQTLHDLTRYVHERAFEVMFHYGDLAASDRQLSFKLQVRLPIDIRIFDVGGGLAEGAGPSGKVKPEQILSAPMLAFLDGLRDERIRWDQPRPVSMRGFLSVMGESITAPPPEAQQLGRASYAIVSDRYLNFSTKAGYHFSTVDTYCGASQNKNYIHFRFAGGGADEGRRARRVRFLHQVLSALDFKVSSRADLLVARLDKLEEAATRERLASLGRLTLCVRQLDMLMSSDAVADSYARFFLEGAWHRF